MTTWTRNKEGRRLRVLLRVFSFARFLLHQGLKTKTKKKNDNSPFTLTPHPLKEATDIYESLREKKKKTWLRCIGLACVWL